MILRKSLIVSTALLIALQPMAALAQSENDAGAPAIEDTLKPAEILQNARNKVKLAREALETARSNGEGVKEAREALIAARAELEDTKAQVEELRAQRQQAREERQAQREARQAAKEAAEEVVVQEPVEEAAPVEEQLEQAKENPITVLPEEVTEQEKAALAAAEKQRRQEARKRRNELLGAAAAGAAVGALVPLLGGKLVEDQGDRVVVERDGQFIIRKDENALLRSNGVEVEFRELENGRTREIMTRPNGVKIVTVRAPNGDIIRRERRMPDGTKVVLINNREDRTVAPRNLDVELPQLNPTIDRGLYIVSAQDAEPEEVIEALDAPPVETVREPYSLSEIRLSKRLRDSVRRLDVDMIRFDSGSATVRQSQVRRLGRVANAMGSIINQDPATIFLIEGHTDAVGGDIYNLALSDRRAETVARILVNAYGLPPENLVVEGYGEAFLKINTLADEPRNRRVAIRNITPLMSAQN